MGSGYRRQGYDQLGQLKVLNGEEIGAPVDLGVDGYTAMTFREGSTTVLEGEGWVVIDAENVDSFGF